MGRARRPNQRSFDPLYELEEEGLPDEWKSYWHGKKNTVTSDEEDFRKYSGNQDPLTLEDRQRMLFPFIWEAAEIQNGKRHRIQLGSLESKNLNSKKIAKAIAEDAVADKLEEMYQDWESTVDKDLYRRIKQMVNNGRGGERSDLVGVWAAIMQASSRDNRIHAIRRYWPFLVEEERKLLLKSMPSPYRLVVTRDQPVRKGSAEGEWTLEPLYLF